jgi:hypothetical protein
MLRPKDIKKVLEILDSFKYDSSGIKFYIHFNTCIIELTSLNEKS